MTIGLVGRKCGMTRVFTDAGVTVPVTVIEALPNRVSQIKSEKVDGYRAVQVTIGARRASRVSKALAGHFAKANVAAGYTSQEFRLKKGEGEALAAGGELKQLAGRALDARQQETVGQIRNYMDGARSALHEGDVRRAGTLAQKAHLLAEDLVKH